jgi:signal transduction histidine kinase
MYSASGWPIAANRPTLRHMDNPASLGQALAPRALAARVLSVLPHVDVAFPEPQRAGNRPPGSWRPPLRDIAIAVVLTIVAFFAAYGEAHPQVPGRYFTGGHHLPHTPSAALLLVVAAGAALAWRHVYPRTVVCVSTAAIVAYTLPGYVNGSSLLLPAIALGTLAAMLPIRSSVVWTVVVTGVLMVATGVNNPLGAFSGGFVLIPANNAVALFAGIAVANRRALLAAARREATQAAERDTQRRIDEERLRIARELHDVVAHTMATITVQAAAATQLLGDRPEDAAKSLQAIRTAGKDGLRELRAILNVLRNADEPDDPTAPTPGLNRLDALAAGVRSAGLPVTVTVTGQPRDLPAVIDLAAYRIIQEALTNIIRHAGPATARVSVGYAADELSVEITDSGRGPTSAVADATFAAFIAERLDAGTGGSATAGHGLRGMRERAVAAGGTIVIGRAPAGGFRVAVRFPLEPEAKP